jgi:polyribonucleotide nucleotidyltransferase
MGLFAVVVSRYDAGVKILKPVAAIAMGLITEGAD